MLRNVNSGGAVEVLLAVASIFDRPARSGGTRIQWRIEGGGASSFSQRATAFFHGGWARPLLLQASDDASSDGSGLGARGSVVAADLAMAVEVQRRGGTGTAMQRRMGSTPGLDGLALGSLFFLFFFTFTTAGNWGPSW